MQKMALVQIFTALCGISGVGALATGIAARRVVDGNSIATATTLSREWKVCLGLEAEDMHFWSSQWGAMESELLLLQAEAAGNAPDATTAAAVDPKVKTSNATQPTHPRHFNPLAGLKLNLNPKSAADLAPALAMLTGLYEDGKQRIGQLNAREKDLKRKYEEKQAEHDRRMAVIAARVKNHSLSKEFGANETRDENRLWTYWEHVRERQHRQYHTSLKIQHSTLTKEKQMIDMYEKTMAGKESKKQLAKEFAKVGGPAVAPEVVLLQNTRREVAQFCQTELAEVRTTRAALLQVE